MNVAVPAIVLQIVLTLSKNCNENWKKWKEMWNMQKFLEKACNTVATIATTPSPDSFPHDISEFCRASKQLGCAEGQGCTLNPSLQRENYHVGHEEIHKDEDRINNGCWYRNLLCSIVLFDGLIPNIKKKTSLRPDCIHPCSYCNIVVKMHRLQDRCC